MARKKKEETPIVEETIVEVTEAVVEPKDALIGQKWEMTSETITEVINETDKYFLVKVTDGCTYQLLK